MLPWDGAVPRYSPWHDTSAYRVLSGNTALQLWGTLMTPLCKWDWFGGPEEKGTLSFHPNFGSHVWCQGAYLVSVGEYGPILPSPMTHLASAVPTPLWTHLSIVFMSFFGLYWKEVEGRVGLELIRLGDSNCQSTDLPKKLFLFPFGKLSFLECSEICHGIPKTSLLWGWH